MICRSRDNERPAEGVMYDVFRQGAIVPEDARQLSYYPARLAQKQMIVRSITR